MRLIARQSVRPTEREVQPGLMPSVVYDGIALQIPKPAQRETASRRVEVTPTVDDGGFDVSRDLAPARGIVTAVGVGAVLWSAILFMLRSAAS